MSETITFATPYLKTSESFSRQKILRLKREIKKHSQNCHKRQHAMLKLQEMMYR